ncbi:MAG: tetratricopeptide repeat protein, partial [Gemmataceae bacterium]
LAQNRTDDAFQLLSKAAQSREATAGCIIQLARAYQARGQKLEALQTLNSAARYPQSPRERADYQLTSSQLR